VPECVFPVRIKDKEFSTRRAHSPFAECPKARVRKRDLYRLPHNIMQVSIPASSSIQVHNAEMQGAKIKGNNVSEEITLAPKVAK